MKDPGSHLFASLGNIRPQDYTERAIIRVGNMIAATSNAKPADKKKAMVEVEIPKVKKVSKKQTIETARARNTVIINGQKIDPITGLPYENQ